MDWIATESHRFGSKTKRLNFSNTPDYAREETRRKLFPYLELKHGNKCSKDQSKLKGRAQSLSEFLQDYVPEIEYLIGLAYPQTPEEFWNQILLDWYWFAIAKLYCCCQRRTCTILRIDQFKNLTDAVGSVQFGVQSRKKEWSLSSQMLKKSLLRNFIQV